MQTPDTRPGKHGKSRRGTRSGLGTAADMDILDKLAREHREVQGMLEQLVASKTASARTQLFTKIKSALIPHLKAEEKIIYDKVIKLKDEESKIDGNEGTIEHEAAQNLVAKLSRIRNKASPEWSAGAKVLLELVSHHVQEEETNIWPHIKDNYSEDEREQMNRQFESAKKKVAVR